MKNHQKLILLTIIVFLSLPFAAAAVEIDADMRLQMGGGGDTWATVTYSDGSDSDLRLGTYFTMSAGVNAALWSGGPHSLELAGLAGWGTWSTGPENTDDRLILSRFPVEALAYYRLSPQLPVDIRLGGGIAYHMIGGITGSGSLENYEQDIDNSLGWLVEASVIYDIFSFSFRYNPMEYMIDGAAWDATSMAASVGVLIPLK